MVNLTPQGVLLAAGLAGLARQAALTAGTWLLLMGMGMGMDHAASMPLSLQPLSALEAPVHGAPCPPQPLAAVAGSKDGQFVLQSSLSSMTASNMASFIVLGKEAAAAGRPRDAEVAFLMSCRLAARLLGADAIESAHAKYQLGWLYARLALEEGAGTGTGARRAELRSRAERLYEDSWRAYQATYGPKHEKTRFAAEGLAALRQPPLSPAPQGTSAPARTRAPAPPQPGQSDRGAPQAGRPAPGEPSAAAPAGPSFDCAKARSVPEKLICSDAELARLDRELGRVYAQAKNAALDSAAFARQNSEEWRRREAACRDRECLLRWYASRREQLVHGMQGQERAPPAVSR